MPIENFSGNPISSTYQRVVQTDGTYLADGTGSILNNLTFPNLNVSGNLYVSGTLFANTQVIVTQSYYSGSNIFGDELSDIQQFTGSVQMTGSLTVQGRTILNGEVLMGLTNRTGTNVLYYDIDNGEITQDRIPGSTGQIFFNENDNFQTDSGLNWDNISKNLIVTGSIKVLGSITSSQDILVNSINIGRGGTSGSVSSGRNIAIGEGNFSTSSLSFNRRNIAIGDDALRDLTTGYFNIAIGSAALKFNSTTEGNIGIGGDALLLNTGGNYNTSVGYQSMQSNTNGETNSAFGYQALKANIDGNSNTAIGNAALQGNKFGRRNTAVGDSALGILTQATSSNNTALGYNAGVFLYSGSFNTFVGSDSYPFETGSNNTVLGGRLSTTSITSSKILNNSVIISDGIGSVRFYSPSSSNVLIGTFTDTGQKLQVSGSARITNGLLVTGSITGSGNILANGIVFGSSNNGTSLNVYAGVFGFGSNTTGARNVGLGYNILPANTTGNDNIAIGTEALLNNSVGKENIAIGYSTLSNNRSGSNNTAIGEAALISHQVGDFNVGVGDVALGDLNSTGSYNTGLGYYAGRSFESGSYNTFLGVETRLFQSGSNNVIIGGRYTLNQLGAGISNSIVIGTNSGSIRLYSPASTNILIGTTTDTGEKLQVSGSGRFTSDLTVTGSLLVKGSQVISGSIQFVSPNDSLISSTGNSFYRPLDGFGNTYAVNYGGGYYGDFTQFVFRNQVASDLVVINGSTGNMGVGNSSPTARLQVKGSGATSATTALRVENSSNATSLVVLDNGNVGIGTTSPTQGKLVISAPDESTASAISIRQSNDLNFGMDIGLDQTVNGNGYFYSVSSNSKYEFLQFSRTTTPNVFLVGSGGNVGIGTTTPTAKLQIIGSGTTTSTDSLLVQNSSGTNLLQVTDGQVTTIGRKSTFTQPYAALYVGNGPYNFETALILDAYSGDNVNYKTEIYSGYSYSNPFRIVSNNNNILYAFEGGVALQLPGVVTQGITRWNTLETLGYYHHIHSPFGSWPSGIKLTNPTTNTGSTDGVYMGLWTSGVDARLWNYETEGTWDIGVGNARRIQVSTSSVSISSSLSVYKSGSTVVDIQGSSGQLLSIIDSLTGSLMSVNDVSGLPILEVSSDDKVVMGTYGAAALTVTGSRVGVFTSTPSASLHVSGAFLGYPVTVPTASGTASLDCSRGNFFNLTLSSSFTLFLSASNIQPGQTINLRITQPATSGSLSYGSQFKFAGGIPYTASSTGSAVDIISFVTFDTTNLYGSAIKNLS
jgi:hypothetical protein